MSASRQVSLSARFSMYAWLLFAAWTACIAVSFSWYRRDQQNHSLVLARANAHVTFNNDVLYRQWVARQVAVADTIDTAGTGVAGIRVMNPAFVRQVGCEPVNHSDSGWSHLTSLQPIRPENGPDAWEASALRSFQRGEREVAEVVTLEDGEYYRLMRPFVIEESCLGCHDAGGHQLGDLHGGISVAVPLTPLRAMERAMISRAAGLHVLMWLIGGAGLAWHRQDLGRAVRERDQADRELNELNANLEDRVRRRTTELQQAVADLEDEITIRQRAEEALRESETRYRTLFEASPVGICVTTAEGKVLARNEALCRILGLAPAAAGDASAPAVFADDDRFTAVLAEARREGMVRDRDFKLVRADGSHVVVNLQLERIRIDGQDHLLLLAEDVTVQKLEQWHLEGVSQVLELFPRAATQRDYLDQVVRLIARRCGCEGVGLRLAREDGILAYVSSHGLEPAFRDEEDRICASRSGCACLDILDDTSRRGGRPDMTAGGSFFCARASDNIDRLADGSRAACQVARYESISHTPIRGKGEFIGSIQLLDRRVGQFPPSVVRYVESVAALVWEALRRFSIEEALQESEERFRTLFEQHSAIMLTIDPESDCVVEANTAAAEFFGLPLPELRGMSADQLWTSPVGDANTIPQAARGTARRKPAVAMTRSVAGDRRMIEIYATRIMLAGRQRMFLIVHDITERHALEQLVLEVGEQERRRVGRDLHDSLGGKLAGAALLGKALANKLAARALPESELAAEVVDSLNESISETREIAHGLTPLQLENGGLARALVDLAGETQRRTGITCRADCAAGIGIFDPLASSHLFRITQEAVANAVRHGAPERIGITLDRRGEFLHLEVWDDGGGMPREAATKPGLGLRTMGYRASVLGGDLAVTSVAGKTVVGCRIPWISLGAGRAEAAS